MFWWGEATDEPTVGSSRGAMTGWRCVPPLLELRLARIALERDRLARPTEARQLGDVRQPKSRRQEPDIPVT